jgi:hypothetical protein
MGVVFGGEIEDPRRAGLASAAITQQPGAAAVPTNTTPSIIWRIVMAYPLGTTRTGARRHVLVALLEDQPGPHQPWPPLAITDAAWASCRVVTLTSCPIATEASGGAPSRQLLTLPAIPRVADAGLLSKAEAPHVLVHVGLPYPQTNLDGAHIARFRQHGFMGTTPMPLWESWMVRPNRVMAPPLQLIGLSGLRCGGFERRRKGNHL